MNYTETIEYLYNRLPVFHHIGGSAYKPGLENTIRLMNGLGNPQNSYRTIHIAGTNGKGSVSHMLAAVLFQAGYKVGLYTSPHLVDFGERIRVNGKMIDEQYVVDFVQNHMDMFDRIEPSFFEATMAMAFDYFAFSGVDVAVIEVGLGGRLDSTNVITPELSVITNISFDHVGFLGNTLDKIAFEKAGIIKHGVPVVIGEAMPETRPVFEAKAKQEEAPLVFAEEQMTIIPSEFEGGKMWIETWENKKFLVGLSGKYQLKNCATVLTAVEQLRQLNFEISEPALVSGLENVTELTGLRGRWETLQDSPRVIADTGHNVAGIEFVTSQLLTLEFNKLHFVMGMVNDKDISSVLALLPSEADYYFTQAAIARALPADELMARAGSFNLNGRAYPSVNEAIKVALANAAEGDLVFIGGSNFVVGEGLACFQAR